MTQPTILHGKFSAGSNFQCGQDVLIDVDEEVVVGDRVVLGHGTHLVGRRITIGNDFYGYSHDNKRLDVGMGRRSCEHAVFTIGNRCTFHDNKIDLNREVTIGDDVGLSPEIAIYTHGYWMSELRGFPTSHRSVKIGNGVIVGFRSTILPGATIDNLAVVGANSVVSGYLKPQTVYGGVPAKAIRKVQAPSLGEQKAILQRIMEDYQASCQYRGITFTMPWLGGFPSFDYRGCLFDVIGETVDGEENRFTDDLRWTLFTHGIRIYTDRPFKKIGKEGV